MPQFIDLITQSVPGTPPIELPNTPPELPPLEPESHPPGVIEPPSPGEPHPVQDPPMTPALGTARR